MEARKKSGKARTGISLAAATGLAFGMVGIIGAAPASAAPVSLDVVYECPFPLIGVQPVKATISADLPTKVKAGEQVPAFKVNINSTMNATTAQALGLIGAATLGVEGDATASAVVAVPGLTLPINMPVTLDKVNVPSPPAEFSMPGSGDSPALTFSEANVGTAQIHVGDTKAPDADGDLVLKGVSPRKADGSLTDLGQFDAVCNLTSTNDVLAQFEIESGNTEPTDTPPTAPGAPTAGAVTDTSVELSWAESTDDKGVAKYEVYSGDTKVAESTTNSVTVTGLTPKTMYHFTVVAVDTAGQSSEASPMTMVETSDTADTEAPSAPTGLTATADKTSVTLNWNASTDNVGVTGYHVYRDGQKVMDVEGTTATVTGLTPKTTYKFTVVAADAADNHSDPSNEVSVTTLEDTPGQKIPYSYTAKGSTFIKKGNGTAALNGSIDALLDLGTGDFEADLALDPTSVSLKVLGFLPTTSEVVFQPVGKTTGTLKDGVLTSNSKVNVKLPSIRLFGIPIGRGENCGTSTPADITLKSTDPFFNPLSGGPVKGTYTLPPLSGCGTLNPIISGLVAGPGNTIDLTLSPKS